MTILGSEGCFKHFITHKTQAVKQKNKTCIEQQLKMANAKQRIYSIAKKPKKKVSHTLHVRTLVNLEEKQISPMETLAKDIIAAHKKYKQLISGKYYSASDLRKENAIA